MGVRLGNHVLICSGFLCIIVTSCILEDRPIMQLYMKKILLIVHLKSC